MKKKTCKIIICVAMFMLIFSSFTSIFADTNPDYTPSVQIAENALDTKIKGSVLLDALANMINAIASLAEYLIGAIFSALTGDNIFPWADRIIFNGIGFLDINFLNPASNSLFVQNGQDSILGQVVKSVYSTIFSLAVLFLGVAVGVMAIRLAISSIAAEKAKYKQAIVNWATCIVMLFLMHYILAFVFWVNEQLVRLASGILIQTIESRGLNSVNFQEALDAVLTPEERVENFIDIAENSHPTHLQNLRDNADIANTFLTSSDYVKERLVYAYDLGGWNDQIANWASDQSSNAKDIGIPRIAYDTVDAAKIASLKENNKDEYDNQYKRGYFDGDANSSDTGGNIIGSIAGKVRHIYIDESVYKESEDFRVDLAYYLVLMNKRGDGAETYWMYKDNPSEKINNGTSPTNWDVKVDFASYFITAIAGTPFLIARGGIEALAENNDTVDEILANYSLAELKEMISTSAQTDVVNQRMKCDRWIFSAAVNKGALSASPTDIIASLGSFFKQSAYVYTTKEVSEGTNEEGKKTVITGWRASEISVTGALLYAIFIFQSCMYLLMYVKRLFYVMMLSMFGPIVVIYDFFMKSAGS